VDSFTFNPYKMLGAPQQTTAFATRHEVSLSFCTALILFRMLFYNSHKQVTLMTSTPTSQGVLKAANSTNAKYLFDPRKNGAEYDLGDASYTCGRRTDAIKLWAMWKCYGAQGIGQIVEQKVDALKQLSKTLVESNNFMLACAPFFYLPDRIRQRLVECGVDLESSDPEIPHDISLDLANIHVQLKLRLHQSGEMMIPYQPLSKQDTQGGQRTWCVELLIAMPNERVVLVVLIRIMN
jgi:hypothetical protein